MKKITITLLSMLFVLPTYATTVTGTGTECTEPILNTDTGPATLQAQWNANTINLNWYSDDTQITVPSASNTCTYDGGITLPTTNPTKEGYTFGGWRVREAVAPIAQCSLKSGFNYVMTSASDGGFTRLDGSAGYGESTYGLTIGSGEWVADFGASGGWVRGIARCSTVGENVEAQQTGNPTDDLNAEGAKYCWCQINGFDEDGDGEYCSLVSSSWVINNEYTSAADCTDKCSYDCIMLVFQSPSYKMAIFGQVQ